MGVGKTALVRTFAEDEFPQDAAVPTIFDTYNKDMNVKGSVRSLELCDQGGKDDN